MRINDDGTVTQPANAQDIESAYRFGKSFTLHKRELTVSVSTYARILCGELAPEPPAEHPTDLGRELMGVTKRYPNLELSVHSGYRPVIGVHDMNEPSLMWPRLVWDNDRGWSPDVQPDAFCWRESHNAIGNLISLVADAAEELSNMPAVDVIAAALSGDRSFEAIKESRNEDWIPRYVDLRGCGYGSECPSAIRSIASHLSLFTGCTKANARDGSVRLAPEGESIDHDDSGYLEIARSVVNSHYLEVYIPDYLDITIYGPLSELQYELRRILNAWPALLSTIASYPQGLNSAS